MGYDFHITRRRDWSDEGSDITASEWLAYVDSDVELHLRPENGAYFAEWNGPSHLNSSWFDWSNGAIFTKNPEPAVIDKMIAIARQLEANVQGDDGELYTGGNVEPQQYEPSIRERLAGWVSSLRRQRSLKIDHESLPFAVGDRVLDPWCNEHTVIKIDPKAEHGMGLIVTRSDKGMEIGHALGCHGLEPIAVKDNGLP